MIASAAAVLVLLASAQEPAVGIRQADHGYFTFWDTLSALRAEHRAVAIGAAPAWEIDAHPRLVIGADTGAHAFRRVSHLLQLPDGRMLGADGLRDEILVFGADGRFAGTWGRPGTSPGEFERIAWMGLCQGEVYVYDGKRRDISVFGLDGTYRRRFRISITSGGTAHMVHSGRGLACGGGAIAATAPLWGLGGVDPTLAEQVTPGPYRTTDLVGIGEEHAGLRELLSVAGEDRYRYGSGTGPAVAFGRKPAIAMSKDRLYVVTGDELEIASYSLRDSSWTLLRADVERARVPGTHIDSLMAARIADPRLGDDARATLKKTFRDMTWLAYQPATAGLLVDPQGCIWVQRGYPTHPTTRWFVLNAAGKALGSVDLPASFELMQVTRAALIGRQAIGDVDRIAVLGFTGGTRAC